MAEVKMPNKNILIINRGPNVGISLGGLWNGDGVVLGVVLAVVLAVVLSVVLAVVLRVMLGVDLRVVLVSSYTSTEPFETEAADALSTNKLLISGAS
jgi:hypothetical protein